MLNIPILIFGPLVNAKNKVFNQNLKCARKVKKKIIIKKCYSHFDDKTFFNQVLSHFFFLRKFLEIHILKYSAFILSNPDIHVVDKIFILHVNFQSNRIYHFVDLVHFYQVCFKKFGKLLNFLEWEAD